MRLVHLGGGEEALVGGDQGQPSLVGKLQQPRFDGPLQREAVPVQLHHATPGERLGQLRQQLLGIGLAPFGQHAGDRAAGAAGEQHHALGVVQQGLQRQLRVRRVALHEALGRQALQVGQPRRVLRQHHDRVGREPRVLRPGERDLAADDRLYPLGGAGLAELQRAEQVAGVGDRHRRHLGVLRRGGDLVGLDRPLAQRIGGVDPQMHEISVRHQSSSIRPSRNVTRRSMRLARSGLWVAISAATPSDRTMRSSSSNTTLLVPTSRLPVGSSASRTPGALARARGVGAPWV